MCNIPSTVTTGGVAFLSCHDGSGSPPPTYSWFKDGTLLPADPSTIAAFKNATYRLNTKNGNLVSYNSLLCTFLTTTAEHLMAFKIKYCLSPQEFPAVTKMDSGRYYCQASNIAGPPQSCKAIAMDVRKYALV